VLRDDGTCWVVMADSYANDSKWGGTTGGKHAKGLHGAPVGRQKRQTGLKPKDLVGIPWRLALALQADGWTLRSSIIWAKTSCMPEPVTDRPGRSHEYVLLLTKKARYFYDREAVREPATMKPQRRLTAQPSHQGQHAVDAWNEPRRLRDTPEVDGDPAGRNARSVWHLATVPSGLTHYATFPPELARRCILAGTSAYGVCATCQTPYTRVVEEGESAPDLTQRRTQRYNTAEKYGAENGGNDGLDTLAARMRTGTNGIRTTGWRPTCTHDAPVIPAIVLDPFVGSGTTVLEAVALGRHGMGLDLSATYLRTIAAPRLVQATRQLELFDTPGLALEHSYAPTQEELLPLALLRAQDDDAGGVESQCKEGETRL
jgi:DNA methylase